MCRKTYRFGGLTLRLEHAGQILDQDFFSLFRIDDISDPDLVVHVLRQALPAQNGEWVFRGSHKSRMVVDGKNCDYTCYFDPLTRKPVFYACEVRHGPLITLYVDHDGLLWDTMVFDAIDLADLFLERSRMIVHSSFIGVGDDGILFAGQKQQGKSTQARLWQTYADAVTINGDRVVVADSDRGPIAYGVPFCGSSRVCLNEQRRIKAIVFPGKGADDTVSGLTKIEAFKLLIGCVSYTPEDPAAMSAALRETEVIVSKVPCYRLICRPERSAVEALAHVLYHE